MEKRVEMNVGGMQEGVEDKTRKEDKGRVEHAWLWKKGEWRKGEGRRNLGEGGRWPLPKAAGR
jgi:hypothetical protein